MRPALDALERASPLCHSEGIADPSERPVTEPNPRRPDHEIDPLFIERWSPRAFTGEAVPEAELFRMLEAARWSPSSYNSQPWRFVYALRDTP